MIYQLHELKPDKYKAQRLLWTWFPKATPGQYRPISIPTIFDWCVQALWALALDPVNEALTDTHNYGFRKGKSPKDAIGYVRPIFRMNEQPDYILEVDIAKCFDNIDHKYIIDSILINKKILKQWLNCGVLDSNQRYYDERGVPQGGMMSPIICNLVLNGFQKSILETLDKMASIRQYKYFQSNFTKD